ncbi:putative aminohydrolase SsnA [Sporomusa acidovorans]|uniref:Aminohydrolase SsnA n=1 Tax=Sporomusa acidovorans (strain ATCC 49682 / DSM 3132 / Mol) TaxID=1123286 RepID=A0ABZ3J647_SPOA4|nr:putative aminohydrolase SsnA [Sporomusa acidovorans]OZC15679.1 8-oxoguanine deaminase [Sporomusa acidovorans DSM 3132]SDE88768.1 putative selenium metabolism protein SsnA [Sporomusa acidovorans]
MLVLKNATIVEFQPAAVISGVDIVIDGSKIAAVGPGIAANYQAERTIDLNGKVVISGIVCGHNHFYSGLSRGIMANIAPSPDFISILKNLWWRLDLALDEESLYYSGLVCSLEAIRCGTTAVIDHHASPAFIKGSLKTLKQAFEQTGLRGITCYETTDRNHGMSEVEAGIQENIDFARLCENDKQAKGENHLVEAMIGGHAPVTLPDAALKLMADAVYETGRGMHIHVAEDRYDVSHSHHVYGKDIIVRLNEAGLINDKALLVHGVCLSEREIEIINDKDAFLAHNARSNMNNAVGYNSKLSLFKNLVLGTDGIGSDMWEEMKFAYFKHKDAGGPMWPDSYLKFLHNGNELLRRYFAADFGRVAAGYKADLTVLDYQSPTPLVSDNIGGHFVFGMGARDVSDVIINGNIVLADRQFTFDVKPIYEKARKAAQSLWDKMDKLP